MWSSNIGWNADSQIGVVSRRQLLKEGYLAAQHHLCAMQRSSYNVTRLSLGSNGLQCGPLPPPLSPFATTFRGVPWPGGVCPEASRLCYVYSTHMAKMPP